MYLYPAIICRLPARHRTEDTHQLLETTINSAAPQAPENGTRIEDTPKTPAKASNDVAAAEPETDEEEEEDEEEPQLKYTKLTGNLASVYRGGDDTSASFVGGDKMVRRESLSMPWKEVVRSCCMAGRSTTV